MVSLKTIYNMKKRILNYTFVHPMWMLVNCNMFIIRSLNLSKTM